MPTTSSQSGSSSPGLKVKRLPTALSPGQYLRANDSLTITTPGDFGVSLDVKFRPCTIANPSVAKYSGVTRVASVMKPFKSPGWWRPSMNRLLRL